MTRLIKEEINRQKNSLNLIESENYSSLAVIQSIGSHIQNSEGFPGRRNGLQKIDKIELIAKERALRLFKLDPEIWDVNVECLSGYFANTVAFSSILEPGDNILGMDLEEGGQLSHGAQTKETKLSSSAKIYNWKYYGLDKKGILNYNEMEKVY